MPATWTKVGEVQGSAAKPYTISRNEAGDLSCSCPAWRFSGKLTCKHVQGFTGAPATAPVARLRLAPPLAALRHHVTGAIERGEAEPVVAVSPEPTLKVMLAETWDRQQNLAGWLVSEKFDGVRAFWTGSRFISRKGNEFHPAQAFLDSFRQCVGGVALDGELWLGRGRLPECAGICNRSKPRVGGREWEEMRFVVFDAPDHPGTFAERIAYVAQVIKDAPFAILAQQVAVPDNATLLRMLAVVEGKGGEGLIAKAPWARYENRRSAMELKVITRIRFEAVVTGYKPGERGFAGTMGACYAVRLDDAGQRVGPEFKVGGGFNHRQRRAPPPVGTIITVEAKGFMPDSQKPREPIYIGARNYE